MEGWTTGNDKYDQVIQSTQKDADGHDYICLQWIPPNDLDDLVEIGKGGFGMVYSGVWRNGKYLGVDFDDSGKRVVRREPLKVAVKLLFDIKDSEQDFLQEVILISVFQVNETIFNYFFLTVDSRRCDGFRTAEVEVAKDACFGCITLEKHGKARSGYGLCRSR